MSVNFYNMKNLVQFKMSRWCFVLNVSINFCGIQYSWVRLYSNKTKGIDFDVPFVEHWHVNGFKKLISPFFENITTSNYGGI